MTPKICHSLLCLFALITWVQGYTVALHNNDNNVNLNNFINNFTNGTVAPRASRTTITMTYCSGYSCSLSTVTSGITILTANITGSLEAYTSYYSLPSSTTSFSMEPITYYFEEPSETTADVSTEPEDASFLYGLTITDIIAAPVIVTRTVLYTTTVETTIY